MGDLVTIQEARAYVLRDENDDTSDVLLQSLIGGFSDAVERYCDRQFFPEDAVAKTFVFLPSWGRLPFSPYELRSATSVVRDGTEIPAADMDTDGYRLRPIQRTREGTYYSLLLEPNGYPDGYGYSEITVTGDWGCAEVPRDAATACLMAIDNTFRNPSRHASQSLGPLSFSERSEAHAIPEDARELLYQLRRLSV